ncbi:MAG: hypothetical protein AMJ63_08040 [Myxococcales bacterium SG8_38_1]|nr:MAG: hypothetical protein AMJ63_08040 [Myxococcales bacterium SG8_38_1]
MVGRAPNDTADPSAVDGREQIDRAVCRVRTVIVAVVELLLVPAWTDVVDLEGAGRAWKGQPTRARTTPRTISIVGTVAAIIDSATASPTENEVGTASAARTVRIVGAGAAIVGAAVASPGGGVLELLLDFGDDV